MKYKLLQIKDFENNNYLFMNYDWAKNRGFKLEDYLDFDVYIKEYEKKLSTSD